MTDGYRGSTAGECEHSFADRLAIQFRKGVGLLFCFFGISIDESFAPNYQKSISRVCLHYILIMNTLGEQYELYL